MLQFREDLAHRLSLPTGKSFPDPNNNGNCLKTMGSNVNMKPSRGDKYSLRPRSLRRGCDEDTDAIQTTKPEPTSNTTKPAKSRSGKPKQKPAPLSKYRRKTANARERSRMREINAAFEQLRRAVPHMAVTGAPCPGPAANTNEKLTKITTLRLAMRYISALSSVLQSSPSSSSSSGTILTTSSSTGSGSEFGDLLSDCSDFDCLLSDGDSLTLSDHSLTLSDQPLTPVDFNESPVSIDTSIYFGDNPQLPLEFAEPSLSPFDPFLTHFS